jgi:hypothetical protein
MSLESRVRQADDRTAGCRSSGLGVVVVQLVSLEKVVIPAQRVRCGCAERCESICADQQSGSPKNVDGQDAGSDAGMSTVEYAVGTVVAAAFAAVLYQIVTGDSVVSGLTDLINRALSTSF